MNPLFRIDFSISDSLKIVRKSVLIYETIIQMTMLSLTDHLFPMRLPSAVQVHVSVHNALIGLDLISSCFVLV